MCLVAISITLPPSPPELNLYLYLTIIPIPLFVFVVHLVFFFEKEENHVIVVQVPQAQLMAVDIREIDAESGLIEETNREVKAVTGQLAGTHFRSMSS